MRIRHRRSRLMIHFFSAGQLWIPHPSHPPGGEGSPDPSILGTSADGRQPICAPPKTATEPSGRLPILSFARIGSVSSAALRRLVTTGEFGCAVLALFGWLTSAAALPGASSPPGLDRSIARGGRPMDPQRRGEI
jgi:hypothetical protein